jgi:hypothetical protein
MFGAIRRKPTFRILRFFVLTGCISLACTKDKNPGVSPDKRPVCGYHSDCDPQESCHERECHPSRLCIDRADCAAMPICKDDTCICPSNVQKCLPVCVTDNDCPVDGHCIDGICEPYPITFLAPKAAGETRGKLQVGIGQVELDIPVGVSMAGYAMRRGPSTPYRRSLGGSNAWLDKPDVRAIVFDDQEEMVILLRIPIPWSTDFMIADTAYKVQQSLGINVIDNIVSSSPHSHSHPARFWHLVTDKYFGVFGYGEFSFEIFDRITSSMADAVIMALQDRRPAKFGYAMIENFDEQNLIYRDRRVENNELAGNFPKDDRLFVMRVDDLENKPIAILTHFGMHGTVFESRNPILSGDAGGGVEVEMTRRAGEKYQRPVTGFYVQGNAGDVSPAGDDKNHADPERIQLIGQRVWEVIEPVFDGIKTSDDIDVSVVSQRVEITHGKLGYEAPEFFDRGASCEDSAKYFRYGAFQCVEGDPSGDTDPSTTFVDGNLHCIFAIECLTAGYPVPQFQKTRLSVFQLGDLAMATVPGEPLSQYGRDLSQRIKETVTSASNALVVGYSQDHHFYLLSEEDWWQGGYEASRVIWGWRLGDYLAENSVDLAKQLNKDPKDRNIDNGNLKPMYWNVSAEDKQLVRITDTEVAPDTVVQDLPESVQRLEVVELKWAGGHPGIDRPQITLEAWADNQFSDARRLDGRIYDDSGFEMLVTYEGDCNRQNCSSHAWRVSWEERKDFAVGRYRLRVNGRAQVNGEIQDYVVRSQTFELIESHSLRVEKLSASQTDLKGRIRYPEALVFEPDGDDRVAQANGHLLRSAYSPAEFGAPLDEGVTITVTATISVPNGPRQTILETVSVHQIIESREHINGYDSNGMPVFKTMNNQVNSEFSVPASILESSSSSLFVVELLVADAYGNHTTLTATVTR